MKLRIKSGTKEGIRFDLLYFQSNRLKPWNPSSKTHIVKGTFQVCQCEGVQPAKKKVEIQKSKKKKNNKKITIKY